FRPGRIQPAQDRNRNRTRNKGNNMRELMEYRWPVFWVTKKSEARVPYEETFNNVCVALLRNIIDDARPMILRGKTFRTQKEKRDALSDPDNYAAIQRRFKTITNSAILTYDQFVRMCETDPTINLSAYKLPQNRRCLITKWLSAKTFTAKHWTLPKASSVVQKLFTSSNNTTKLCAILERCMYNDCPQGFFWSP
ncbi:hypothetical protein OAM67_01795, partial [bacterium]|nr:hypothetical protein [bacterium]